MTTPQQGSCSTRPPVGCGGACMSAVALLATVVQRIRIAYSPIRIEITYPRESVIGLVTVRCTWLVIADPGCGPCATRMPG